MVGEATLNKKRRNLVFVYFLRKVRERFGPVPFRKAGARWWKWQRVFLSSWMSNIQV